MKQLLSLFLFLVPCLAWAQYPSNGNQKITLGEQTTADGLIYRGVAATDTLVRKPSIDTMAYIVLDTTTNIMWHYKKATSNAWLRLNLLPSDTASMLTNYWRADRFSGTLPVANGGTNTTTLAANKVMVGNGTSGVLTPTNLHWDNTTSRLGINKSTPDAALYLVGGNGNQLVLDNTGERYTQLSLRNNGTETKAYIYLDNTNSRFEFGGTASISIALITNNTEKMRITTDGDVGIGQTIPTEKLHVVGNGRFTAVGAGAYSNDLNITSTGVLTTASSSDETFKYNINPITYGLSTILQLKPVSFQWKKGDEHDLGFIAQDAVNIIPEAVDTFWDSSLLFRSNTIIPILTKAIQEQQALIKALEQRIINLENK
jgi:hypothetical protein